MTEERLPLAELLAKAGDGDFLRSVAEAVLQLLMETDVDGLIGAGRHERSGDRTTYRNGYRDRTLDTRLGTLQLRIPKLRQGSYFPALLERPAVKRGRMVNRISGEPSSQLHERHDAGTSRRRRKTSWHPLAKPPHAAGSAQYELARLRFAHAAKEEPLPPTPSGSGDPHGDCAQKVALANINPQCREKIA